MALNQTEPLQENRPERHPLSERFHHYLELAGDLHDQKQADYGTDNNPFANICASEDFGVNPWVGAVLRGNDKMARIKSFVKNGYLKNESVEDSLMDLAVYAIIALVLFEQQQGVH